ncbi:MAG: asparagine synthetase B family protein [Gemmatimonadales bacterium]
MSGIAGLVTHPGPGDARLMEKILHALGPRGADQRAMHADRAAALGVQRADWELGPDLSGGALVVRDGDLVAVADASLYYRGDLLRRLEQAGIRPTGPSSGHLILAAYRAWGAECAAHLEGDFAFILWDAAERRLHCARDFSGRRPLYYAVLGNDFVVASTIAAIRAHPRCPGALNLAVLAETASALVSSSQGTCYAAVSALSPGMSLTYRICGAVDLTRQWEPPSRLAAASQAGSLEAGAEELRALLSSAVAERLPRTGPAAVSLSGGWDSTAVYGIAQQVLHPRESAGLVAVSISYPVGDPGREDELIRAVTSRWNDEPRWLDIASIPLFQRTIEEAALRDEPFCHPFQHWNSALAAAGRLAGARVMLDGYGGDQLFASSNVYLADLVRQGRWREFLREWRVVAAGRSLPTQFRWIVLPLLPPWAFQLAGLFRGRSMPGYLQRGPAPWIRHDFVLRFDLVGRQEAWHPPRRGSSCIEQEMQHYLTSPFFAAICAQVAKFGLEAGVETRSPLYDARVIAFAASRPREERNSAGDSKRLLRRAVQGLVPEEVLAPRTRKTGTTNKYFGDSMRRDFSALASAAFGNPKLAELGIVDAALLRDAVEDFMAARADAETASQLYFTLQTELWLQSK